MASRPNHAVGMLLLFDLDSFVRFLRSFSIMKTRILVNLISVTLLNVGHLLQADAVIPPPDGGYPGGNTAEGQHALFSLTAGGFNTAVGFLSLRSIAAGQFNTAIGAGTLVANTADQNTAIGAGALLGNSTGIRNTANGAFALFSNTIGSFNSAHGAFALFDNTTGASNTATGDSALFGNTTGNNNAAYGLQALVFNTTGSNNTAFGYLALHSNATGNGNIAIGANAGTAIDTGGNNIDIGNTGLNNESDTIRIGTSQTKAVMVGIFGMTVGGSTPVLVNANGLLGTSTSSARFKTNIQSMGDASGVLLALKPVTFRYKKEIDPAATSQFGLIAEEVAEVNPDLVVRDKDGKPYSVRYDQVNAMLLNEFLKEHKKTEKLEATVASLIATVKEQAAQIQKVSAQLEAGKPAPQVAENN